MKKYDGMYASKVVFNANEQVAAAGCKYVKFEKTMELGVTDEYRKSVDPAYFDTACNIFSSDADKDAKLAQLNSYF